MRLHVLVLAVASGILFVNGEDEIKQRQLPQGRQDGPRGREYFQVTSADYDCSAGPENEEDVKTERRFKKVICDEYWGNHDDSGDGDTVDTVEEDDSTGGDAMPTGDTEESQPDEPEQRQQNGETVRMHVCLKTQRNWVGPRSFNCRPPRSLRRGLERKNKRKQTEKTGTKKERKEERKRQRLEKRKQKQGAKRSKQLAREGGSADNDNENQENLTEKEKRKLERKRQTAEKRRQRKEEREQKRREIEEQRERQIEEENGEEE